MFITPRWVVPPKSPVALRMLRKSRSGKAAVMGDFILVDVSPRGQTLPEASA